MGAILLSILLAAGPPEMEARVLDGRAIRSITGALLELGPAGASLQTPEGRVDIPSEKLLGLSPKQKPPAAEQAPGVWIDLVDGSTLPARDYAVEQRKARATMLDGQAIEIATRDIATVRLQGISEAVAKEWDRIQQMKIDGDLLVTRKDEVIDYHQGAILDVSDKTVEFEADGEKIPVKRPKVFALVYYHAADREPPSPICRLRDATGACWAVQSLQVASGKLQWVTPAGVAVSRPLESIAEVDFSGGKIIYLSDLRPESVKFTDFFGMDLPTIVAFYAPRMDQNLFCKPLRLGGKTYAKGVAMHSRTEMVYRLPGRFSRFEAVAGIDEAVRNAGGNVQLVIRGDDRVLLDVTIADGDAPRRIELDLSGVRRLTILVDFGANMHTGDHLDLCDARIIK